MGGLENTHRAADPGWGLGGIYASGPAALALNRDTLQPVGEELGVGDHRRPGPSLGDER